MNQQQSTELNHLLDEFRKTDRPFDVKYKIADWIDNYAKDKLNCLSFNPEDRLKEEEVKNEQAAKNLGMIIHGGYKLGFSNGWKQAFKAIVE